MFGAGSLLLFNHELRLELIDEQSAQVLDDRFGIDCEAKECFCICVIEHIFMHSTLINGRNHVRFVP